MTSTRNTPTDPARAAAVFYDGGCPVCRTEIATYSRMQGGDSIDWCDVVNGAPPAGLDRETALARFHARRADGTLVSGFRAFLAVWRVHPRLAPLARLLDRPPFTWVGEAAYRLFLLIRPLWRRVDRGTKDA